MKALLLATPLLIALLGFSSPANASGLKLLPATCRAEVNSKVLAVTTLQHKVILSSLATQPKATCQIIEWGTLRFLQVNYQAKQTLSYSNQVQLSNEVEIFDINSNNRSMFAQNLEKDTLVWSIEQNHLLGRILSKDDKGQKIWLNGYVFDPASRQFTDYQFFAKRLGWKYKE